MYFDEENNPYVYAPGDRVVVRDDLQVDGEYYSSVLCRGHRPRSTWYPEKQEMYYQHHGVFTILNCEDGFYQVKEDEELDWCFVDTMFSGLESDLMLKEMPGVDETALDEILCGGS